MAIVVGDDSGLCKELSWWPEETHRIRIIKKAKQSRTLSVACLCWSGPTGGKELSELAVGRSCGTVEAFSTTNIVCDAPAANIARGDNSLAVPLRSFQLPSTPVTLSMMGSEATRAYTRSLICKEWLGSDISPGVAHLRDALLSPAAGTAPEPTHDAAKSSSLLLAVGQKGHACIVEWKGSFSARLTEDAREAEEQVVPLPDIPASEELTDVRINFRPIRKESAAVTEVVYKVTKGDPFRCKAAYLLPGPVATASNHPLCRSLLAFGGKENDAKVVDLDYGKSIWAAKNVKPSFLGLRCEVTVTQIDWLLSVHPMILVVGNAKGALRFYDLRCQRRPVLEISEATQEKRPVTSLCVRPSAEVLKTHTDIRVALGRVAEAAMLGSDSKVKSHSQETSETTRNKLCAVGNEEPAKNPTYPTVESGEAAMAGRTLLTSCSGKESAAVYYADSYGMVYGLRVVSGNSLLRLADRTCPKFNPSSYRSLDEHVKMAERSAEDQRKLILAMLEKQRRRLSSKKNDHPLCIAACTEFQLAAVPIGGFKGAMGAISDLTLDPSGKSLIAVGLGRYAYLFDVKSRKLSNQAFLKQKLTCVLAAGGEAAGGFRLNSALEQQPTNDRVNMANSDPTDGKELNCDSDRAVAEPKTLVGNDGSNTEDSDKTSAEFASRDMSKPAGPLIASRKGSSCLNRGKRKAAFGETSQRHKLCC